MYARTSIRFYLAIEQHCTFIIRNSNEPKKKEQAKENRLNRSSAIERKRRKGGVLWFELNEIEMYCWLNFAKINTLRLILYATISHVIPSVIDSQTFELDKSSEENNFDARIYLVYYSMHRYGCYYMHCLRCCGFFIGLKQSNNI